VHILSYNNDTVFGLGSAVFLANDLDLIVEGLLFLEIAYLVLISLNLEIVALLGCHGLPLLANLLHHLESTHVGVRINYPGSGLRVLVYCGIIITSFTKIIYAERHFLGFFRFSEKDSKDFNSFSYLSLSRKVN
jgi:hypothetical protein